MKAPNAGNAVTKLAFLAITIAALPGLRASEPLIFVYFKEPADMGVFFATSDDGYNWRALNGGKPWIPVQRKGELMRDPFIARAPDGEFHMVWTWNWRGTSIGYAHSPDLVHWSDQKEIPLMAGIQGAVNTWAPEIYWDKDKARWIIIWSSTVEGKHDGNRIYKAYTADFNSFSRPAIFFDPGYMVIDATLLSTKGHYYMIFKDERREPLRKVIKIAEGATMEGPWQQIGDELTESWSEGPSAIQVGPEYIIYYDHYREPRRYEAIHSIDLRQWTSITDKMHLPEKAKHGSFMHITEDERRKIESANPPSK